ncbi:hypothetical protein C7380_11360 [Oceanotoga teriensis]|uniref:DUF327 family protein n=1 Tax=Oceanotoga teriensis TaxID=515440 RepID=A0AA45C5Z3_9BACT|nr:YaaR family protein [Oceanotoga teriensis]PWJ90072.1 hypothetical protein C7380_11360 [Oceanotoga teriensis]
MNINPLGNNKKSESKGKTKKIKKNGSSKKNSSTEDIGFFDILTEKEYEISQKELKKLVDEILNQGNRFVKSPTQINLNQYKRSIKEYLKKIEKKLYKVKEDINIDNGNPRLHIIAEVVDQKIQDITKALINKEKNTLNFASKVEEINGLLLDLYR